jgi:hypothetical protein
MAGMKKLILFFCGASLAIAQTSVDIKQVHCSASLAAGTVAVVVAVPSTVTTIAAGATTTVEMPALVCATVDPATLALDTTKTPPVLHAIVPAPAPVPVLTAGTLTGAIDGANTVFIAPAVPVLVTNNGLVLAAGVDYSVSGVTVTFAADAIPQPGDILQAFHY